MDKTDFRIIKTGHGYVLERRRGFWIFKFWSTYRDWDMGEDTGIHFFSTEDYAKALMLEEIREYNLDHQRKVIIYP